MPFAATGSAPVVRLAAVSLSYGKTLALDTIDLDIPASCMVGLIGPDGVGKSSLMSLVAGARVVQKGRVEALGGDMASARHRNEVCPNIAYMPQGAWQKSVSDPDHRRKPAVFRSPVRTRCGRKEAPYR